jgi:hypothetical protein
MQLLVVGRREFAKKYTILFKTEEGISNHEKSPVR